MRTADRDSRSAVPSRKRLRLLAVDGDVLRPDRIGWLWTVTLTVVGPKTLVLQPPVSAVDPGDRAPRLILDDDSVRLPRSTASTCADLLDAQLGARVRELRFDPPRVSIQVSPSPLIGAPVAALTKVGVESRCCGCP
jgi:hypothetical protein